MENEPTATGPVTSRVVVIDDHPFVREGLTARLGAEPDFTVCGQGEDIPSGVRVVSETAPDLVVLDISLRDGNGIDLIKRIKSRLPEVRILVWSMHDESLYAERALRAGARGYVNKAEPTSRLIEALRQIRDGKVFVSDAMTERMLRGAVGETSEETGVESLSERELDVFRRLGQGKSIAEIGQELHISPKTVETYRDRIRAKLHLNSGPELLRAAMLWVMENG